MHRRMQVRLIVFVLAALLLAACSSRFVSYGNGRYSKKYQQAIHVVRKGETLYSIAWQHSVDYRKVAAWNHIFRPYTIFPGQRIKLVANQEKKYAPKTKTKVVSKHQTVTRSRHKYPIALQKKNKNKHTKIKWRWPTDGTIISRYSDKDPGKKGLDIKGRMGQPIYAAASGEVVYSGNGLRGYGNLIIIKHNDVYFSAYAHNRNLFVKEAEKVKLGQKIADMGNSEASRPMLHFEIRRNGKPSNPLRYLPNKR
ncbi:MAG: peptidoglycan DD-metalloendopeptidase family protein [Gammaproteobacteria bacterium]|nr:peptidoglycan DD-metalloendopeptidase family protein [Gammaproteobacteria bacterium]